jgi:phosphate transport system substrate-binding protein
MKSGNPGKGGSVAAPRPFPRGAWLAALAALAACGSAAGAPEVVGAGASFPAPAVEAWGQAFARGHEARVVYRSVGSGEGIRRATARTADFAMTDVPLTQAELRQDDLMQFPVVAGAVVPVVNVPGVGDGALKLTGPVLARIYLGQITRWNEPPLQELNPGLALPELPIQVVHRADGSGTSFVFTYYLSTVEPQWREALGIGSRLHWPVGTGAKGNEGVAAAVRAASGSIGYVEYTYAVQYGLAAAQLLNRAGAYLRAGEPGVRAALAAARWSRPGYYEVLVDRGCAGCWPIVGVSFALVHRRQDSLEDGAATLEFLRWVLEHGAQAALELQYVPLEDARLVARIESSWNGIRDGRGRNVWRPHGGASRPPAQETP